MSEQLTLISVCIANYNGRDVIAECIDSVKMQQGSFKLEIIIHDDSSSDQSVQLIKEKYSNGIKLIESAENLGFCISNNRMVQNSKGDYILLLNNDATLRLGALEALLKFAQHGHKKDIIGLPQYIIEDGSLLDRGYRTDPFLNPIPIFDEKTHEAGVATGACLWIPRELWDEIGGFPPWFGSIAEDIFICQAARLLDRKIWVLEEPYFEHWVGKNIGGGKAQQGKLRTTVRRRAWSERNKTATMMMTYPLAVLIPILVIHFVLLTIEALVLLTIRFDYAKIRSIYFSIPQWLWRNRLDIKKWRNRLMFKKRATISQFYKHTQWTPHKLTMLMKHGLPIVK